MNLAVSLGAARPYFALTKPRILPMVLFSGIPALGMASVDWPLPGTAALILLGIALAGAAANTLNCYVERERDGLMERTAGRPLPSGQIAPRAALRFGLILSVIATGILYAVGGVVPAALGVASILYYVFIYTIWLKPRSAWNAVVGGAAGAVAPLIADAALNGSVGPAGLLLFAIIFAWQPPHVWAIALYRKQDYANAGIPMLPSTIGDEATRWRMLWCTLALAPVTLAPVLFGLLGSLYLASALVLNAWFVWHAVRVLRERTDAAARRMFQVSLVYLGLLFLTMIVELVGVRFQA